MRLFLAVVLPLLVEFAAGQTTNPELKERRLAADVLRRD